jgi:hypothetical protein
MTTPTTTAAAELAELRAAILAYHAAWARVEALLSTGHPDEAEFAQCVSDEDDARRALFALVGVD